MCILNMAKDKVIKVILKIKQWHGYRLRGKSSLRVRTTLKRIWDAKHAVAEMNILVLRRIKTQNCC